MYTKDYTKLQEKDKSMERTERTVGNGVKAASEADILVKTGRIKIHGLIACITTPANPINSRSATNLENVFNSKD